MVACNEPDKGADAGKKPGATPDSTKKETNKKVAELAAKPDDLSSIETGTEAGQLAPEITGEDLDGEVFNLSDYRGKVVMLDFWGDW